MPERGVNLSSPQPSLLIIDEDTDYVSNLAHSLKEQGYRLLHAKDLDGLMNQVQGEESSAVEAILCSWQLSNGDGLSILKKVRNSALAKTPFLLITESVTKDKLAPVLAAKPDAVLIKPFAVGTLLKKIQAIKKLREEAELNDILKDI
jgi:two-component system, OmpR family, response regulator